MIDYRLDIAFEPFEDDVLAGVFVGQALRDATARVSD
jgi:hypothetical protein